MSEATKSKRPWLVAVWPGMGHVAISAGYYLMAKLGMQYLGEFTPNGLFDVDYAIIKSGIVQKTQRPRSRFFIWKAPDDKRDIIVFIGEAQPPLGKFEFCEKLIDFARDQGVERVFTFAAMATDMHPEHESRLFGAATDQKTLKELDRPEVRYLEEGHVSGLNGVLLAAAVDKGMEGVCLLGEMPHLFAQLPFPKASLAVLEVFAEMAEIPLDFTELKEQAQAIEQQLGELLAKFKEKMKSNESGATESFEHPNDNEEELAEADQARIETLFAQAADDRSKAYELKNELDRLGVFEEFEDRFLDLFQRPE
ncbi:PAC2 family protein [Stieleria neptunia]|uniref:PAC2 family protein n=1 Tax=Stieleria neptunia TaxID=2527979 RepID=A0A518HNN1_9BACT|nr:PAC2 family protein [Stieleria neptunia]QDV42455.1 PAC2 family protein [Stieleria neptunia]